MTCLFCHKGPADGVTLYRINAKGVAGIWACLQHKKQTDAPPVDREVARIVKIIEGAS